MATNQSRPGITLFGVGENDGVSWIGVRVDFNDLTIDGYEMSDITDVQINSAVNKDLCPSGTFTPNAPTFDENGIDITIPANQITAAGEHRILLNVTLADGRVIVPDAIAWEVHSLATTC